MVTLTYWPGHSLSAPLSTSALATTVPEVWSTLESMKSSLAVARGEVSWPALMLTGSGPFASAARYWSRSRSGMEKLTRSCDISVMVRSPPGDVSAARTTLPTEVLTCPTRPSIGAVMVM